MSAPGDATHVGEEAASWRGASWQDASNDALLVGARMSFRERLQWNAEMVALWARGHPELARRVLIEREPWR